jgi:hypothetical protein
MQIVSGCGSADEFIERFAPFTTETEIIVPALPGVSEGISSPFAICLSDGSFMMKGRCEVTEVRPASVAPGDAVAPAEPALMRLRLREMDAHSAGIHLRLMDWRTLSPEPPQLTTTPTPPRSQPSDAVPADAPVVETSAVTVVGDMSSSSDGETTTVSALPSPEARAPRASLTLPANPLSEMNPSDLAAFVESTLPVAPSAGGRALLGRARRIGRRMAPYASGLVVGLLLGIAIKSGSKPAPVAVAANLARPPVAAPPPVVAPPPVAAPPASTPPPAVASAPDGEPMPAPWSRHRAQRSNRLPAKVIVTSSPPNAFIKVNKHRMGRAPREIRAPIFERVRIEASLPGYKHWKKTLYLEEAEVKLEVKLVRVHELATRRLAPASGAPTPAKPAPSVAIPGAMAAR